MEFEGTVGEKAKYESKFIRIGDRVFVTEPGDTGTPHGKLAESDGIKEEVFEQIRNNPTDVDAGFLNVDNTKMEVVVYEQSFNFRLPKNDEARALSGTVIQDKLPNYKVSARKDL